MEEISQYLQIHKETIHAELFVRVWLMTEKLRFHPLNSKARGKTMQIVLNWFFDASSWLTLADLNILYSLLARTGTTKPTSVSATEISELSSKLSGIDMAKNSEYIAVPEFQTRGAVHFHALFWGLPSCLFDTERATRLVAGLWGHGFVYMKMTDGNERLSSYLAKYMAKSFIDHRLMNQKAYVCSRNLKRPQIQGGISNFGMDVLLEEFGATTPETDKSYDTHWLGTARHRIYKISTENPQKSLPK